MELTTERVPTRRRGPIAVGAALVALLVLLVARPWDSPEPRQTPVAVAQSPAPSGAPSSPSSTPSSAPSPADVPSFLALPTPDLAPVGAGGGAFLADVPSGVALVQCDYRRNGGVRQIGAIQVQPPTVFLDPESSPAHIRRIGWRFEVQSNQQQSISDGSWRTVDTSRWQVAAAASARPAAFTPLDLRYEIATDETTVLRVRVIVEWYTRNDELAGRSELFPPTYREGRATFTGAWPAYCRVVL